MIDTSDTPSDTTSVKKVSRVICWNLDGAEGISRSAGVPFSDDLSDRTNANPLDEFRYVLGSLSDRGYRHVLTTLSTKKNGITKLQTAGLAHLFVTTYGREALKRTGSKGAKLGTFLYKDYSVVAQDQFGSASRESLEFMTVVGNHVSDCPQGIENLPFLRYVCPMVGRTIYVDQTLRLFETYSRNGFNCIGFRELQDKHAEFYQVDAPMPGEMFGSKLKKILMPGGHTYFVAGVNHTRSLLLSAEGSDVLVPTILLSPPPTYAAGAQLGLFASKNELNPADTTRTGEIIPQQPFAVPPILSPANAP